MAAIEVKRRQEGVDPFEFEVRIGEGGGETQHFVTMAHRDWERLSGGASPESVVEALFRFLLDREPKEAILARFDASVVSRYFPAFERELPAYLDEA